MLQVCVGWQYLNSCLSRYCQLRLTSPHLAYYNGPTGSYMKSSSQFSSRSWLLDPAMFSSLKISSYAWSF